MGYMTRMTSNLKTAGLLGGLMGLFVWVGGFYGQQGMMIGLILGGLTNVGAWFSSDRIALSAMQGREVDERSAPELYRMVDELRRRAGLPMPRVYVCPHEAP